MFNLEQFFTQLKTTPLQRTSYFTCAMDLSGIINSISLPATDSFPTFTAGTSAGADFLKFSYDASSVNNLLREGVMCSAVSLPSRQLETADMTIYGVEEKYPIFSTYTDLNCEFMLPLLTEGSTTMRNAIAATFHHWQDYIHQTTGNASSYQTITAPERLDFRFPDNYRLTQGCTITQYSPIESSSSPSSTTQPMTPTIQYQFFNVYPVRVESTQLSWGDMDDVMRLRVSFAYTHWTTNRIPASIELLPPEQPPVGPPE